MFAALWIHGTLAAAATLEVCSGCAYKTVTDAVSAASDGDTVHIRAGSYEEQVVITADLTLVAIDGPGTARMVGDGGARIRLENGAVVSVEDLTFGPGENSRAARVNGGSSLSLDGVTVSGFLMTGNGAGVQNAGSAGTVSIRDSVFVDNMTSSLTYTGGHVSSSGDLIVSNSSFSGGWAGSGGALAVWSTADLSQITVVDNDTRGGGGGLWIGQGAIVDDLNSRYIGNHADIDGGAVGNRGDYSASRIEFFDNRADNNGGAVWTDGLSVFLHKVTTYGNQASRGGFLRVEAGAVSVSTATIAHNSASLGGGAIHVVDGSVDSSMTRYISNTANFNGGALRAVDPGTVAVTNDWYLGNSSEEGGAISSSHNGPWAVRGTAFDANSAASDGGAIAWEPATTRVLLTAQHLRFEGNVAAGSGGGVYSDTGDLMLQDARIYDNDANTGGGVEISSGDAVLERLRVCGNVAVKDGGGLYFDSTATGAVHGSLVMDNTADNGGGLYAKGDLALLNNTWVHNNAGNGAGAYLDGVSADVGNNIVFANSNSGVHISGGSVSNDYNLWYQNPTFDLVGGTYGSNALSSANPALSNVYDDGDCTNDDAWLKSASPAIDAGNPSASNNDLDNSRNDMGAYGGPNAVALGVDADGDGRSPGQGDCDDSKASVYPGANENAANGVDANCDGAELCFVDQDGDGVGVLSFVSSADMDCLDIGEAATAFDCDDTDNTLITPSTWFLDSDGDGYGNPSTLTTACGAPSSSYVRDGSDCDDNDDNVHPAATEVCNSGIDDNCNGTNDDGDSTLNALSAPVWWVDKDADGVGAGLGAAACLRPTGYADTDGDCDDNDATVWPNAPELCDSIDNDCDSAIDEGVTNSNWYPDADGDGFGDSGGTPVSDCQQPSGGGVTNSGDCDDSDSNVNPSALEVCNNSDDDCNGTVDDFSIDASPYYPDTDGDGYGAVGSTPTYACSAPSGHAGVASDCDDNASAVYPNATEQCDGIDNDCDSLVDDGAGPIWYDDTDGDGYGGVGAPACTPASGQVQDGGDCDDTDDGIYPGAPERCDQVDNDCSGAADDLPSRDRYPDADGDGYGDDTQPTRGTCLPSADAVEVPGDCDDEDPKVNPGANDIAGDGIDQDCDGQDAEPSDDQDGDGVPAGEDCDDNDASIYPGAEEQRDDIDHDCDGFSDASGKLTCGCSTSSGSIPGLALLLLLLVLPMRAQARDCEPLSHAGWRQLMDRADTELSKGRPDRAKTLADAAYSHLDCLDRIVNKRDLGRFARQQAAIAYFMQDDEGSRRWGLAGRLRDPKAPWPSVIANDHPLRRRLAAEKTPPTGTVRKRGLDSPRGGGVFLDGAFLIRPEAAAELPHLVQIVDRRQVVLAAWWQDGAAFPEIALTHEVEPATPPDWLHELGKGSSGDTGGDDRIVAAALIGAGGRGQSPNEAGDFLPEASQSGVAAGVSSLGLVSPGVFWDLTAGAGAGVHAASGAALHPGAIWLLGGVAVDTVTATEGDSSPTFAHVTPHLGAAFEADVGPLALLAQAGGGWLPIAAHANLRLLATGTGGGLTWCAGPTVAYNRATLVESGGWKREVPVQGWHAGVSAGVALR